MKITTKFSIGDTVRCSIEGREFEFTIISIELKVCPPLPAEVIYRASHPYSGSTATPYLERELSLIKKGDKEEICTFDKR
jgi:hypothetical protein